MSNTWRPLEMFTVCFGQMVWIDRVSASERCARRQGHLFTLVEHGDNVLGGVHHLLIGGIELRVISAGFADRAFQVIRDDEVG